MIHSAEYNNYYFKVVFFFSSRFRLTDNIIIVRVVRRTFLVIEMNNNFVLNAIEWCTRLAKTTANLLMHLNLFVCFSLDERHIKWLERIKFQNTEATLDSVLVIMNAIGMALNVFYLLKIRSVSEFCILNILHKLASVAHNRLNVTKNNQTNCRRK